VSFFNVPVLMLWLRQTAGAFSKMRADSGVCQRYDLRDYFQPEKLLPCLFTVNLLAISLFLF